MRTTLDIADDVLYAAKELARTEHSSLGEVLSRLARQSLTRSAAEPVQGETAARLARFGIQALPHRGGVVTDEQVNRIRKEEGI